MLIRRALPLVAALACLLVAAACGGGQAKVARTAQYKADTTVIFTAVVDAAGQKYKVDKADAPSLTLVTVPRWYEPEGNLEDMDASGEAAQLQDGSLLLRWLIRVTPGAVDGAFKVEVVPQMQQMRSGYAKPVELKADDLSVPGWVHGKTDDLYETIYASLKTYAVTTTGT
jgi:hypothetical protein